VITNTIVNEWKRKEYFMTQTYNEEVVINDNLVVDGIADETQVKVQGHSTQSNPLQSWQDSAGTPQVEVTGDGRLAVGDAQGAATPDAMVEIHRDGVDDSRPKRGLNVTGELVNDDSDAIDWSVHELALSGGSTTTGQATALRAKVTTDDADVDKAVGIEVAVDKEGAATGTISEAVGIEVADINQATSGNNYAIRTGDGKVQLGDLSDGLVKADANGELTVRKDNYAAIIAPTSTDDTNAGYEIGSRWIDTVAEKEYVCLDVSVGAAVWQNSTSTGDTYQNNYSATSAPTTTDDTNAGYEVGSRWIDVNTDKEYVCLDATASAAVWKETTTTTTLTKTTKNIVTRTILHEETLSAAGNFDITNISQDYDHLEMKLFVKGSSTADSIDIYFNNDLTATNYINGWSHHGNSTNQGFGNNSFLGWIPDSTRNFSTMTGIIAEYTGASKHKMLSVHSACSWTWPGDLYPFDVDLIWKQTPATSAINRITVVAAANTFAAGSSIEIVGIKEESVVTDISGDVLAMVGDEDEGSLLTWDSDRKSVILAPGTSGQVLDQQWRRYATNMAGGSWWE
jgi:hypothetical protein